jgi:opacity protein-like surface antigen
MVSASRGAHAGVTWRYTMQPHSNPSRRTIFMALLVGAALALAACAQAPAPLTYSGDWSGTMTDATYGTGALSFTLEQDGVDLSGVWSVAFALFGQQGTATGTINATGTAFDVTFETDTACEVEASGTRAGPTISGTYVSTDCAAALQGTFTATLD